MKIFKTLLLFFTIVIVVYTITVGMNNGWNLFKPFFSEILAVSWSGQFNLDFSFFLILSGLWTAWRNKFTTSSIGLGLVASVLGILFLAPYLLYLLNLNKGDMKAVLIGKN